MEKAHYGVWILFSWQFADNARWTQPRNAKNRGEGIKVNYNPFTVSPSMVFNPRHHQTGSSIRKNGSDPEDGFGARVVEQNADRRCFG